jgi:hypothetical protein
VENSLWKRLRTYHKTDYKVMCIRYVSSVKNTNYLCVCPVNKTLFMPVFGQYTLSAVQFICTCIRSICPVKNTKCLYVYSLRMPSQKMNYLYTCSGSMHCKEDRVFVCVSVKCVLSTRLSFYVYSVVRPSKTFGTDSF